MSEQDVPGAPAEVPSPEALLRFVLGSWISQAIAVAAQLGIADLLVEGPKRSEELAAATGAHAPSLYRLLRSLAAFGVFREEEAGSFALSPLGEHLQSDVPGSLRAMAVMQGAEFHRRAWTHLLHSVRTGEPAFDHVHGIGAFEYFNRDPEAAAIFNDAMTGFTSRIATEVPSTYDFSGTGRLVDVGGGHGTLLAGVLRAYPHLRGVLYDLPPVVEGAAGVLEAAGVADRCEVVGGSFFERVPEGDACLLKSIIHDWGDEEATAILRNCRRALPEGGRVLLVESLVRPGGSPAPLLIDLEMLVMTRGGRERSEPEYRALLEAAGFRLERALTTPSGANIIEGVKV